MDMVLGNKNLFLGMANKLDLNLINFEQTKDSFIFETCVMKKMSEEIPKADIVFGLELSSRQDYMHQRNSGLNHILAKQLKEKDIVVCFSLNSVFENEVVLGRMKQNVKLCRKYKVKMIYASLASDEFGLRTEHDLQYFAKAIGFNSFEIKNKDKIIQDKILFCNKRKEGKIIGKGVEIVD
jgi:hypothetical protein